MKLLTTLVTSVELSVKRDGESIGAKIDAIILDCIHRNETVTNVSLEIPNDDWVALKVLRHPMDDDPDFTPHKPTVKPTVYHVEDWFVNLHDSLESFGPFPNQLKAKIWARKTNKQSFSVDHACAFPNSLRDPS